MCSCSVKSRYWMIYGNQGIGLMQNRHPGTCTSISLMKSKSWIDLTQTLDRYKFWMIRNGFGFDTLLMNSKTVLQINPRNQFKALEMIQGIKSWSKLGLKYKFKVLGMISFFFFIIQSMYWVFLIYKFTVIDLPIWSSINILKFLIHLIGDIF